MKKTLLFCSLVLCFMAILTSLQAQNPTRTMYDSNGEKYKQAWQTIDSLQHAGLPRSALEKVNALYEKAKADNNPAQQIKCLIYKIKYESQIEEEGMAKAIMKMEEELTKADFPIRPVLQSMLGEMYYNFLEQNYWRFSNRTQTLQFDNEDLRTWSPAQLLEKSTEYLLASTKNDSLKAVEIAILDPILIRQSKTLRADSLRPTLFDFLTFRAIDHFKNDQHFLTEPAYKFHLNNPLAFAPIANFTAVKFESRDTVSFKLKVLQLYQRVLDFHKNDQNPSALIDANLHRLDFVYQNAVLTQKGQLYEKALKALMGQYSDHPFYTRIAHKLAEYYHTRSSNYQPIPFYLEEKMDSLPEGKWDFKTAYDICEQAIQKYPNSVGAVNCRSLQSVITKKNLSVVTEAINLPNQPILAKLSYRNIDKAHLKIAPISEDQLSELRNLRIRDTILDYLNDLTFQKSWSLDLPSDGDYRKHNIEFKIKEKNLGAYVLMVSDSKAFDKKNSDIQYLVFQVSNISYLHTSRGGEPLNYIVLHRNTGAPLPDVKATFYRQDYNQSKRQYRLYKVAEARSDKNGFIHPDIEERRGIKVKFEMDTDVLFPNNWYSNYYSKQERRERTNPFFFLDRAIYRPGQTIYFKSLIVNFDRDNLPKIVKNKKVEVRLLDANYQEVATQEFTTNEYGTISGQFVAPRSGLLGNMYLKILDNQHSFRVEEYKRPKFEVAFEPIEKSYALNEQVTITGTATAYAGSNVDNAEVTYRVVREVRFPYWSWWRYGWYNPWRQNSMEITNGTTNTNEKGQFEIEFEALADPTIPKDRQPVFSYTVYADVTDINGETQSGTTSIRAGYVALELGVSVPDKLNLSQFDSLTIISNNLNGQAAEAKVELKVVQLKVPDQVYIERQWGKPDRQILSRNEFEDAFPLIPYGNEDDRTAWTEQKVVYSNTIKINGTSSINSEALNLKAGAYVITAIARDKNGEKIEVKKYITAFDPQSKKPPVPAIVWTHLDKLTIEPGETQSFKFLSSEDQLCIYGEMENRKNTIRKGWINIDGHRSINHTVTETDRGGVGFRIYTVRYNRFFTENLSFSVPWSNKDLKIEYATFRDKLKPGQEEEWQLKISGPKGDMVAAELLAGMYDESLDAFASNRWYVNLYPNYYQHNWWRADNFSAVNGNSLYQFNNYVSSLTIMYPQLQWFGFKNYPYSLNIRSSRADAAYSMDEVQVRNLPTGKMNEIADATAGLKTEEENQTQGKTFPDNEEDGEAQEFPLSGTKPDSEEVIPVRTNLDETVFFFPHLRTDEEGKVIIKFTMNEALTRWKFMSFAHTQDLKTAYAEKSVVTQKELMVLPNPPRFFREGDTITFTARVSNLTENELDGTAHLQIFDALTNEPVDDLFGNTEPEVAFTAKAGQSDRLAWTLEIPRGKVSAVIYRVTAKAGAFSDGEERALPILTNRMLVTETLPLPVRANQTKSFTLKSLKNSTSNTLDHHALTLEYTSNPAWYAVQALPYLMEYPYECNEQIFSRYYANSLATHIANAHPKVKAVFDKWRNFQPEALLSNLSKNQELKTALLEETPWVLQAKSEAMQKQNIALLFDLNRMSYELENALTKLSQRQYGNGGWPWFAGGQPDWYITQYIVSGIGHLQKLGVQPTDSRMDVKNMVEKAIGFCDFQFMNHYQKLKEAVANGTTTWEEDHLDPIVIHYLYMRSFFLPENDSQASGENSWIAEKTRNIDDKLQKVLDYYSGQATKYWTGKNQYQQGMLALSMHRFGNTDLPQPIVKSLKERALHHEELGMYWKYPVGWWWHQAPIETHALMIEVFGEVAQDEAAVDELKVWLLKNKQTTHWKTTKATASAVYALLMSGDNWLLESTSVQISFPNSDGSFENEIKKAQQKAEAGTGYFKVSLDGDKVSEKYAVVKVQNPNSVVSWGSLYWQYFEEMDKIESFEETPLQLKKQLFKVVLTDTGEKLIPITASEVMVGDKLKVRIELRVDRSMEYVHMKDSRASGFEPINVLSSYKWQGGLGYYESTRDASTNFFFSYLPKGTHVFEYQLRVAHAGDFSNGITTIQCMYAPEFTSHSEGVRVEVEE